jgi:hypothetical protein
MASGGHNRKTSKELAAAATARGDRVMKAPTAGRGELEALLESWLEIAGIALQELRAETSVTIVNAGDQVQKHPGVTVFESASKRIESLVVLLGRVGDESGAGDDVPEPPRVWKPKAVDGGK